jgi:hypothetical protein
MTGHYDFVAAGSWIGLQCCLREDSNRTVQRVLLKIFWLSDSLCWIQRWAAPLPELVADGRRLGSIVLGHEAQGPKSNLRLADGPSPVEVDRTKRMWDETALVNQQRTTTQKQKNELRICRVARD